MRTVLVELGLVFARLPRHAQRAAGKPFRRMVFGMHGERLAEVMQLADELGSVREIVSRLLRTFESRAWVRLERERITVLEPKALSDYTRAP